MGSLNNDGLSLELGLLADDSNSLYAGDGSVDINGNPASKSSTGGWKACPFILGSECCERLACFGTSINLVTYLTKKLHEGNISAARNVTTWRGTCYLSSLIGAFLADAYLGRFWTIAIFAIIYLVGMGTLTLSASVPALKPPSCIGPICPEASPAQYLVFYFGLYLIALGTGGIKPCVSSFGADQFDDTDSRERVKKGSFFNWFFLSINIGALVSSSLLVWIQDNKGWGLGFGIPTLFMGIAIFSFFAGSKLYRFQPPGGSPLTRVCQVVVGAGRKWWVKTPVDSSLLYELPPGQASAIRGSRKLEHTDEFRFLDKAAIAVEEVDESKADTWQLCTVTQVEELKILLRMFPIWATGVIFSAVYAQISIMFVEQGMVMDPNLWGFTIPPASLLVFEIISAIIWVPLYDRVLIPVVRRFTGRDRGFTELQRMGIGMAMFIFVGAVAAVVEMKRLQLVKRDKLVGPTMLTILWQIPQYFLAGAAEVFTLIGQLEFFYDQSSDAMRSICSAYALLTAAFGNYLSSFIMTTVATWSRGTSDDEAGWIPDNLNEGHLDYFFWFLSGLSFMNLIVYLVCANNYKYKKTTC